MFHYEENITDSSGTALNGWSIGLYAVGGDPATAAAIPIYSDRAGTTLIPGGTVRAVSLGYVNFYVPSGAYSRRYYDASGALANRRYTDTDFFDSADAQAYTTSAAASAATATTQAGIATTGAATATTQAGVATTGATTATAQASNALQAALTAQGFSNTLSAAASALPYEVTGISGGIGTGTGGMNGTYVGGVSGGPAGFQWTYTIAAGALSSYTITNPGLATTNAVPTLSLPLGSLTAPTIPTATVGTIPVSRVFLAPSTDATQILAWTNSAAALASYPVGITQFSYATSGLITSTFKSASVAGGEYALTFGKAGGPIMAGITDTTGLWDFSGVRTLPVNATDGTVSSTISGSTARSGFLFSCYDSVTRALLFGVQTDGTFAATLTVAGITAPDLSTFLLRGSTPSGSPKTGTQNLGRLAALRSAFAYLKNGNSALAHIILDGDSWLDSKAYGSSDAIARFFADSGLTNAGPGWIGLASALAAGTAIHGAAQPGVTISRSGTWADLFKSADVSVGTIQNFPGYDAVQSGADGSIYTLTGSTIGNCTSLTLYCGKGGGVEQSWDGATWNAVTVTAGSGSTTATINMTGKTSTLRLRCTNGTVIAGLFGLTASSGVVFSNFGNSGSTAAQKASVQSNADYKAMMAALPGDALAAFIQLGLNDTKAGTANATTVTNVAAVAAGYRAVFTGFPSCDVAILCQPNTPLSVQDTLAPLLRVWAEDNGAAFLDWQTYFGTPASSGDYASYSRDYTSGSASTALPLLEVSTAYRHPSPASGLTGASKSAVLTGAGVVAATLSNVLLSPLRSN